MKKLICRFAGAGIIAVFLLLHAGRGADAADSVDTCALFGTQTVDTICAADKNSIDLFSNDLTHINSYALPDTERIIQSVEGVQHRLWIGTDSGLYLYDELTSVFSGPFLKEKNIKQIEFDGKRIWMIVNNDLWSCAQDLNTITVHEFARDVPAPRLQSLRVFQKEVWITAEGRVYFTYGLNDVLYPLDSLRDTLDGRVCAVSGNYIAVGTGSGDIAVIDKLTGEKQMYSLYESNGSEHFITAMMADGQYLWIGTFEGLFVVDVNTGDRIAVDEGAYKPSTINFFIGQHNRVIIGTDEKMYALEKPYRAMTLTPRQSYVYEQAPSVDSFLSIPDTVSYETVKFDYRLASFPDIWHQAETLVSEGNVLWKTDALPSWNEWYELRASIEIEESKFIYDACVYKMDAVKPFVSFDALIGNTDPGLAIITGRFNKRYISSIIIDPFHLSAQINQTERTFKSAVILKPGKNLFTAQLTDCTGKKTKAERAVFIQTK